MSEDNEEATIGHNSGQRITSYCERVERLEEEKKGLDHSANAVRGLFVALEKLGY